MDTITHAVLGAAVSQTLLKKRVPHGVALVGALAAALPDADIFISSSSDPTVSWLFHRHFTHSIIAMPIGGLIASLPFLFLRRFKGHKPWVILTAIICYATHAALDSLTSYGTQLFWPFANARVAVDWIGIVDPVYSLPLLAGVIWTARTGRMRAARGALLLTSLYLCFGGWQHHRAVQTQRRLAAMRGQAMLHARAMPAPGWLVMWRSVYATQGEMGNGLVVDGMRIPWFGASRVLEGGSVPSARFEDLPPGAQANAETRRRFDIFNWFADGLIAKVPGEENAYGDERFTIDVESLVPLWGLKIDPATGEARRWSPPPGQGRDFGRALRVLIFGDARYRTLEELKRQ